MLPAPHNIGRNSRQSLQRQAASGNCHKHKSVCQFCYNFYHSSYITNKVNVKQSHYRLGQAQRFRGGRGSQISRQLAHEGGKVVSTKKRPPLPSGNNPGTHFCSKLSQPKGHNAAGRIMTMKNPMTPSGIEPAAFRLVA